MRSGGCGAAVAHDEDCAVFIAGFEQQVDKIVDFRSVQAVYGIFQLGQISSIRGVKSCIRSVLSGNVCYNE